MANIKDVVDVQIDIQSSTLKSENFSLLLILGTHKIFTDLYRQYNDVNEMLVDGFKITDNEYIAANNVFRQNPSVPFIYIGRRQADSVKLQVSTVIANTDYFVKINTNIYIFDSGPTPSAVTIAAGIVAAMVADPTVSVVDHTDGTYTISSTIPGTAYILLHDDNQSVITMIPSNNVIIDLEAIKTLNNQWYALIETLRIKAEVIEIATWVEGEKKLFGTVSNDSDIIDKDAATDLTSLPALFKAVQYHYTWCLYHSSLDDFIDAAWMGRELAKEAGTSTWALKELTGIVGDNLTENQSANAFSKQCNTYEYFGGTYITREGKVFDNKYIYIDITRGLDWLINDIETALFNFLIEADKIPYIDTGITMIRNQLSARLSNAVSIGILAPDPAPLITVPKVIDIPEIDKQDRILRNVNFTAVLTGAIHKVIIRGTVSF